MLKPNVTPRAAKIAASTPGYPFHLPEREQAITLFVSFARGNDSIVAVYLLSGTALPLFQRAQCRQSCGGAWTARFNAPV